ncbi:uncharacterized protein G2W53_000716 [Senna tora]|uniref:Uncharacterized protein n=1 Tax=Senna tora TaxID=362788 RepID=A0A835CJQ2_9FABA|nr:uncharacterized protein G2W53_000716 [Senna tora]
MKVVPPWPLFRRDRRSAFTAATPFDVTVHLHHNSSSLFLGGCQVHHTQIERSNAHLSDFCRLYSIVKVTFS